VKTDRRRDRQCFYTSHERKPPFDRFWPGLWILFTLFFSL